MRRCGQPRSARAPLLALLCGCACSAPAAHFATRDPRAATAPRLAPGVAVDPVLQLPDVSTHGGSDASLLVLAAPQRLSVAHATIERFFRALVAESPTDVDALLSEQAQLGSTSGRQPGRSALRSRFLQLDFAPLKGVPVYREQDVEVYERGDLKRLQALRGLPAELAADQLFVRVRLSVTHAGKNRLLADEMGFFLRPEGEAYRIVGIREDTPVP